jgi:hypothetical protein
MFYVYLLHSIAGDGFYIGYTSTVAGVCVYSEKHPASRIHLK